VAVRYRIVVEREEYFLARVIARATFETGDHEQLSQALATVEEQAREWGWLLEDGLAEDLKHG
jgi:hypothetical protein